MESLSNLDKYKDSFFPLCDDLEKAGKWTKIECSPCPYWNRIQGVQLVYKVCWIVFWLVLWYWQILTKMLTLFYIYKLFYIMFIHFKNVWINVMKIWTDCLTFYWLWFTFFEHQIKTSIGILNSIKLIEVSVLLL